MTDLTPSETEGWLALREASEKMGVSPATLRAWADEGRVQSYRTPGGHRRFWVNAAATPFIQEKRGGEARWRLLEHSVVAHVQLAREEAEPRPLTGQARNRERELERELIRLGTLALAQTKGEIAQRANELGGTFAKFNWQHGIAQRQALDTLARLRRAFMQGVVEFAFGMGEPDVDELNLWLGRVNELIDLVSVSMLEYRSDDAKPTAGK